MSKMEDPETKARIEETVQKILQESNMDEVTESKVRKQASTELGLNLSQPPFKSFVKQIIEAFLQQKQQEQQEEEQPKKEETSNNNSSSKFYDDSGDLVICELGKKRKVTIQDFKGRTFVSLREFYTKDGKELPSTKGISLTAEQWSTFQKNVPAIEKAIQKMESRI